MGLALKKDTKYTYADYLTWGDDERWEIINGEPFNMSPAPIRRHQDIVLNLATEFKRYLKGKSCKVYISPFDIRLKHNNEGDLEIINVVQPDISIFCDKKKLDDKGGIGAPDLIVEVLSPSTQNKDLFQKLLLYQKFGVREYWIIDPEKRTISISTLGKDGLFFLAKEDVTEGIISPFIFPDLSIKVEEIFE